METDALSDNSSTSGAAADVPTRTLAEQIAGAIAHDIVNGTTEAGQRLVETELASRFNVSRGPIRDALDLLERNMLVTMKPRSHTVVNRMTVHELEQLFTIRQHVLGLAAMYAANYRTDEDLEKLGRALDDYTAVVAARKNDPRVRISYSGKMWDLVIGASHSNVVLQTCRHLRGGTIWHAAVLERVSRARMPAFHEKRAELWSKTFNAIRNQRPTAAKRAGSMVVQHNWDLLKDAFERYFPE